MQARTSLKHARFIRNTCCALAPLYSCLLSHAWCMKSWRYSQEVHLMFISNIRPHGISHTQCFFVPHTVLCKLKRVLCVKIIGDQRFKLNQTSSSGTKNHASIIRSLTDHLFFILISDVEVNFYLALCCCYILHKSA